MQYYLFKNFSNLNLICAFSTRASGNMSLIYGNTKDSLEARKNFLKELGVHYLNLICAKQIHTSQVKFVQETDKGKGAISYDTCIPDTDAFVTDRKNLALAIFTADCLPIFLYDPKTPAIGLIHNGWRNGKENITIKTINLMKEKFNSQVKDLYVGFGPSIRSCCYEVGREFINFFPLELIERNGNYYLDLVQINKKQILSLGVKEINIFDSGICTSCQNEEFFSYHKEGSSCGRMMSVIMLR